MKTVFRLQIVDQDGLVARLPGGGPLERDLVEACVAAVAKRYVGMGRTQGSCKGPPGGVSAPPAHRGTAANTTTSGTGFANDSTGHVEGTGSGFDNSALGGQFIGLSINGGTAASWTVTQVWAEAMW